MNKKLLSCAVAGLMTMGLATAAEACTRVVWQTENQGTFVTRTMDWSEATNPHLVNMPAGAEYTPHLDHATKLKTRYDVTGTTTYGIITDGMNSAGLSGNVLYDRNMHTEDDVRDGEVGALHYLTHILGQFATVEEAVKFVADNPAKTEFIPGVPVRIAVHISLQDVTGDSAIIEFSQEGSRIWHGAEYSIMTNQPDYDQHLANIQRSQRGWGELDKQFSQTNLGTGGNTNPEDRFIHASYFFGHLKEPTSVMNGMLKLDSTTYKIPQDAPNMPINGTMAGYATEYSVNYHLQSGETLMRYQMDDHYTQLQYNMRAIQETGKAISFQLVQPGLIGDITGQVIKSIK
ncbi:linear amide C-N hydrolase [Vibrio sp. CAU 1672]|uniref:linear amide C-N hydrolase n=1 Tax=Vibrio sp. CAU 1672 TaxID=3032594 RepID=UPI0023DC7A38|nr:linear amide C-N hydrolase [Vibrio sp. CAU 1672]MDF2154629.1 linear amide C-N hydrolase [Vibrio sp. CAU 1672]